jgi:hypothetical protein
MTRKATITRARRTVIPIIRERWQTVRTIFKYKRNGTHASLVSTSLSVIDTNLLVVIALTADLRIVKKDKGTGPNLIQSSVWFNVRLFINYSLVALN